jgi:HK97 family phage prohead protease
MELERKSLPLEVKAVEEGGTFEGYAAVFGNVDARGDIILPGAFTASLMEHKGKKTMPALLWQHDPSQPIGVWESMAEDERGLFVKGRLLRNDVQKAGEAWALLKAGALSGLSIGYKARDFSIDETTWTRTLKKIELFEASLVTFPANDKARIVDVKGHSIKTIREFEAALRDVMRFSAGEAKRIASHGFKAREVPDASAEFSAIIDQITNKYNGG